MLDDFPLQAKAWALEALSNVPQLGSLAQLSAGLSFEVGFSYVRLCPKLCKTLAFFGPFAKCFGPLFDILWGYRYDTIILLPFRLCDSIS